MLAMTETAAEAINVLTQREGHPEAGLRVAVAEEGTEGLQLSLAVLESPEVDDQVVGTESGAKVFLEPRASEFLDDKVLDVQQNEQGELNFAVYPQQD